MKEESSFLSRDGIHQIHCVKWLPPQDVAVTAVLQIAHGMTEFIERYENFAVYLNGQGFAVVGNDHLGHGQSVDSPDEWGYFADKDGAACVVEDMHTLRQKTQAEYPDLPYFMLGHSMGSYLLRRYLTLYAQGLRGAVIVGTGTEEKKSTQFGMKFTRFLAKFFRWHHRSILVTKLAFGAPYKGFDLTGRDLENSWLTRDADIVKWCQGQPACNFLFTLNGYYNLFETVEWACDTEKMQRIPKDLPLLFASGANDPVGNLSKGVLQAYHAYQAAGIRDVTCKLYEEDRHEILNELDRETVYRDIGQWLKEHRD